MATRMKLPISAGQDPRGALKTVQGSASGKVKVAVTDIDGVLRGKYLHKDKFASALEGGFGFCDVVFGWDMTDSVYDNTKVTGWQHGFPDAMVRLDLSTGRNVPWDDQVPFFLGDFVTHDGQPYPVCPRQTLKRVIARTEKLGFRPMCGLEFEWFNFAETPQSWAAKKGVDPTPVTPGMFGYSLLRANANREYFNALMDRLLQFRVPIEGLHTETGPGVYEAALQFSDALECADRGVLFKSGAKEIGASYGIIPSFMAKWNKDLPGCSGHVHQSAVGRQEESLLRREGARRHEQALRELPRRAGRRPDGVRADVLADRQQLQAAGRRLLGPGQAHVGDRQPHRELPRDPGFAQEHAARDAVPGCRHQSLPRGRRARRRGNARRREGPEADSRAITGTNQGSENVPRAPRSLRETTAIFKESGVARDWLGDTFVEHFALTREWEWRQWQDAVTDWELKRYFEII